MDNVDFFFLQSPYQVDMKNIVKCWKDFFGYFNALETHSEKRIANTSSESLKYQQA